MFHKISRKTKTVKFNKAMNNIPDGVTSLELSENGLGCLSPADLSASLERTPNSVTMLILKNNNLATLYGYVSVLGSPSELVSLFTYLGKNVTTLDLSNNYLGDYSCAEFLATILGSISETVVLLNLSNNNLYLCGDKLAFIFSKLSPNIISLDISNNGLQYMTLEHIQKLNHSLPQLRTIILSLAEVNAMSPEQCKAFGMAFPNIENVNVVDANGKEITHFRSLNTVNKIRFLGGKTRCPSLLESTLFSMKNRGITDVSSSNIAQELKSLANARLSTGKP